MEDSIKIISDIKAGRIKPFYFLMGEEPYHIDRITECLEDFVLTEDEKGFNQTVMYGRDVAVEDIISVAKRYPMMADRQVVIVREAQDLSRTIENLLPYAENPTPSTVLVMAYKYKTLDKRKSLVKNISKHGVLFESKKMYDNQLPDWIKSTVNAKGYDIEPKATRMFAEFLGTDLSRIVKEVEKLEIILPKGSTISAKDIEVNIGFNKDFNNFELTKAISTRDLTKAYQITQYFAHNQKEHNIHQTLPIVFGYFSKLLQYHGLKDKSKASAASALKVSPYYVGEYVDGSQNYPMRKVSQIVAGLREIDLKSKGVGASMPVADLLKEMLIVIFG